MNSCPKPWGYDFWKFMHDEHGLTLLESEMQDILREAKKLEVEHQLHWTNVAYVCIFLRNAGEKFRAIVLARDVFGISLKEARAWVESVKWERVKIDNSKARELHQQYPCHMWPEELKDGFEVKISHFPAEGL